MKNDLIDAKKMNKKKLAMEVNNMYNKYYNTTCLQKSFILKMNKITQLLSIKAHLFG